MTTGTRLGLVRDRTKPENKKEQERFEKLTPQERVVLTLIGYGLKTQEIADRLELSTKTIEWHRANLGYRLHVKNRVELTRIALRHRLVSLRHEIPGA